MISRELLSEVLGVDYKDRLVDWFQIEDDNYLRTYYNCGNYDNKGRPTGLGFEINIYELAHKCKEWAFNNGYYLNIYNDAIDVVLKKSCKIVENITDGSFKYSPMLVFKACQWILDNKENK